MNNNYSPNSVNFNAERSTYIINDSSLCQQLNLSTCTISEKNLSISQINYLRTIIDKTTLTDYEIELLNKYSNRYFLTNFNKIQSQNMPLKLLFPNLNENEYSIDKLILKANRYLNGVSEDGIEGFFANQSYNPESITRLLSIMCCFVLLLVFTYIAFYGYSIFIKEI